ncbi:hypothetical protein LEP1GSC124_2734 [Leptospira interrogans serovar Pyrogenes str. 200701872]|uniref:Uncharacterized protein n=1 Tax=Leptospira interrogans serovar Pyrogenes str. 200701872 TaxID=1193029 RepID=M6ZMG1_LEPIR|nr:hypothetical protein LEP1GSC124_2734 [Leptospira interrogans serovar Pyrogenes str. 200701872]
MNEYLPEKIRKGFWKDRTGLLCQFYCVKSKKTKEVFKRRN